MKLSDYVLRDLQEHDLTESPQNHDSRVMTRHMNVKCKCTTLVHIERPLTQLSEARHASAQTNAVDHDVQYRLPLKVDFIGGRCFRPHSIYLQIR